MTVPTKNGMRQPQTSNEWGAMWLSASSWMRLIMTSARPAPVTTRPPTKPRQRRGARSMASGTGPA